MRVASPPGTAGARVAVRRRSRGTAGGMLAPFGRAACGWPARTVSRSSGADWAPAVVARLRLPPASETHQRELGVHCEYASVGPCCCADAAVRPGMRTGSSRTASRSAAV